MEMTPDGEHIIYASNDIIKVLEYTPSGVSSWTQVGQDLSIDVSGLDISDNSQRIIVTNSLANNQTGEIYVYDYNSNNSQWELIQTLSGESNAVRWGGSEIRISGDGETIIAAETIYDSTDDEGRIKVWKYNSSASPKWSLTGIPSEFLGEGTNHYFASGVSVNYDGSRIAAGTTNSFGGRSNNGYIKVFDYTPSATDSWTLIQTGTTTWTHSSGIFYGEDSASWGDRIGAYDSFSLSSNGSKIAFSAYGYNIYSGRIQVFQNFFFLPNNSPATLTITSDDSDNIITSGQVTLTATFSQNMAASPKISISGVVTNVSMTQRTTAAVWTYYWQVPSNISSGTTLNVTATATDTNNLAYSGNASLTLTISPTFYLASNGVTIKCSGCSAGDTGMVSGVLYTAHDNTSLANKNRTDTDWDRVVTTLVTDMSGLFDSALGSLASQNRAFNQNLSSWDTSNVTNMSRMFIGNVSLSSANQNFNSWDTSKVTDMSYMFASTDNMNPQITSWDVSSVNNMEWMFFNCRLFNRAIGSWDVSSVTNMSSMFAQTDYFNQNIGSWNTSSVTNMGSMFSSAFSI